MSGDLYDPEAHQRQQSSRKASGAGTGIKKLFWYLLTLVLGAGGISMVFGFLAALTNDQLVNAKPEQQGEIFGGLIGGIIAIFLASKCLKMGREAGL